MSLPPKQWDPEGDSSFQLLVLPYYVMGVGRRSDYVINSGIERKEVVIIKVLLFVE
jgi:hypothetical protein